MTNTFISHASEIGLAAAKQTEERLLAQLNWLVDRGLLVVRKTDPKFLQLHDGRLVMEQDIRLELLDKEYVEKLENENTKLKMQLEKLKTIFAETR